MENNLENKAKFFAQYWGQQVAVQNEGRGSGFKYSINAIIDIKYDYLELTPLSQITDEDAKVITLCENYISSDGCKEVLQYHQEMININSIDFLRSKGYALPYMGLSVEQLIEYGWIKLKE